MGSDPPWTPSLIRILAMWNKQRTLLAVFLGALGGLALDQIHVQFGVLFYANPWWLEQAWWVAPLFAAASLLFISLASPMVTTFPGTQEHRVFGSAAALVGAYWVSAVWQAHPIGLAIAYPVVLLLHSTHRPTLMFAGAMALIGTACEVVITGTGAFTYRHPDFLGVPYWLPGLYLQGAPLALAVATWVREPPQEQA